MTRWVLTLALALGTAAHAIEPGAVELVDQRTERATSYRLPDGTYATSSDGRPAYWWDGQHWRDPDPIWRGGVLRGLPGPLVWRAEPDRLVAETREGLTVGALGWRGVSSGHTFAFRWHGLRCTLVAGERMQKFSCAVRAPLGRTTLRVPVSGHAVGTADGAAIIGGLWRVDRLIVIGADGIEYPEAVSAWRVSAGALSVRVDDRALPASAFPYVIDPTVGSNYPSTCTAVGTCSSSADCPTNATCTSGSCVARTAWTNPTNAQSTNNVYATASLTAQTTSAWLKCANFGFTSSPLDDAKTIKGMVVEAEVKQSGGTLSIVDIRAGKADGTISTANRATGTGCVSNWTTTDTWKSCGHSLELWGETWTPADIRDADFGFVLAARNANASATRTASVDAMRATIYYAPPDGNVYATGWDTLSAEDGSVTGSPAYSTTVTRTGLGALELTAATSTAEEWCAPTAGSTPMDSDLTNRAYARAYLLTTAATPVPLGQQVMIMRVKQDSETGCYALLGRDTAGAYSVTVRYHGKETADRDFGTYALATLNGTALGLGQVLEGARISCPLWVNGVVAEEFSQEMSGDCSGGACDIATVCVGTPATGSVANYSAFGALNLNVDDLSISNAQNVGLGRVNTLHPNGIGSLVEWTQGSCGSSNEWECVNDWQTGVDGACVSDGDTRQRGSVGTLPFTDIFTLTDLTLATTESIEAVRPVMVWCANTSTNVTLNSYLASGSDVATSSQQITTQAATFFSMWYPETPGASPTAWTDALVDGLVAGYEKAASPGESRATALLVYVDVRTPDPQPDRNLQDYSGDGYLTLLTGCDSITAGTLTGSCSSAGGVGSDACTASCDGNEDCGGGVCTDGRCNTQCSTDADCATCSAGAAPAICTTSYNWVSQLSQAMPEWDIIINCGMNGMPFTWWETVLPDLLTDPISHAPPCTLIRGAWGHCSSTTTLACSADTDCGGGQTCVWHEPDYMLTLCGANDVLYTGISPGECRASGAFWGLPASPPPRHVNVGFGLCPQAATTPGPYQFTRQTCTADAQCASLVGANSKCTGYCEGHADPVRACYADSQCGECSADATRSCFYARFCSDDATQTCNDDADCAAGTCTVEPYGVAYSVDVYEAYGGPGSCGTCVAHDCLTATKYCTGTCDAVSCSTDADCTGAGSTPFPVLGGACNTSTGKCELCGWESGVTLDTPAERLVVARRMAKYAATAGVASFSPSGFLARQQAAMAAGETAGTRMLWLTYGLTAEMYPDRTFEVIRGQMAELARTSAALPHLIDANHAMRYLDDRIAGGPAGTLLIADGLHNSIAGAAAYADIVSASMAARFPACSTNPTVRCGYCDISCSQTSECSDLDAGTTGDVCTSGHCACSADADCRPGCTCQDIDAGAPTDKRCVCDQVANCPAGNGVEPRWLAKADAICTAASAGSCTQERVGALCTRSKIRCTTTADCDGPGRGDVCAVDGVWQPCTTGADCTRDGGPYADSVCAGYPPVGASTPTPPSRFCHQPTPTP